MELGKDNSFSRRIIKHHRSQDLDSSRSLEADRMEKLEENMGRNNKCRPASFDDHHPSSSRNLPRATTPVSFQNHKVPRLIRLQSFSVADKNPVLPPPPKTPIFSLGRPFPLTEKDVRRRRSPQRELVCAANDLNSPSILNLRLSANSKPAETMGDLVGIPADSNGRFLRTGGIPRGQYIIATPELLRSFLSEIQEEDWNKASKGWRPEDARRSRGSQGGENEKDQIHGGQELASSTLVPNEKEKITRSPRSSYYAAEPRYSVDYDNAAGKVFCEYQEPPDQSLYRRLKTKLREPAAEAIAACLVTIFNSGAASQVSLTSSTAVSLSVKGSYVSECFGSGIGLMIGIYVAGGISGGHINPIVTITLATFRGFPWRKVIPFCLAQTFGGLVGSLVVHTIYQGALDLYEGRPGLRTFNGPTATGEIFFTTSADYMSYTTAFFSEFLVATILLVIMMAIGDRRNSPPPDGLNPIVLMWVLTGLSFALGSQTSYSLNPGLDLAARLVASVCGYHSANWTYKDQYWLWSTCMANMTGAFFGAFLYDFFIYEGSDSPLNRTGASADERDSSGGFMSCFRRKKSKKSGNAKGDQYV